MMAPVCCQYVCNMMDGGIIDYDHRTGIDPLKSCITLSVVKACLISLGACPSASQLVACTMTSLPYKSYTSHGKKLHSCSFEPILSSECHPEFKHS